MNKYRDKSDFEINKDVAIAIGAKPFPPERTEFRQCEIPGLENAIIVKITGVKTGTFDPCNNPADAMPIVIENGISLINSDGVHFAAAPGCGIEGYLGGDTVGYGSRKYSENENIYRAAMEVFLMMKEAENEKS
ncbi:phage protein NinX family protein [Morganella morganii]|uniref:phage protein NinX family protein n=1 Tax=Morganella morganii TaxID=582 RepID=UPI0034E4E0EE